LHLALAKCLDFLGEGFAFKTYPSPAKSNGLAKAKPKILLPPPQGGRIPGCNSVINIGTLGVTKGDQLSMPYFRRKIKMTGAKSAI
jgi:hypothetical protein